MMLEMVVYHNNDLQCIYDATPTRRDENIWPKVLTFWPLMLRRLSCNAYDISHGVMGR